ncbi:MAG: presqualene diphosphate synthase HpnD [Bradyrhizobium sp.]|nr:MAG: presqualene diphosphate synthase HpnD [Bradyrhizobium sp.]
MSQAGGSGRSSFYLAMRVLPTNQRDAMFSIYRFCREVDDVADEPQFGERQQRLDALDAWRGKIAAIFAGNPSSDLSELASVTRQFALRRQDFEAVIAGVQMDVDGEMLAPDWPRLDLYCDRVASAVGRLSTPIFGMGVEIGDALAFHLGRALQLTNILRDVDEDAAIGRLYLPREALDAARVATDDPASAVKDPRVAIACVEVARRARGHFERAQPILANAPRSTSRAPYLMAAAYRSLLDNLTSRGFAPPRARVKPSRARVLGALLWHGLM